MPRARVRRVPVPGDLPCVLGVHHRVKEGLVRESQRERRAAAVEDEFRLFESLRAVQRDRLHGASV